MADVYENLADLTAYPFQSTPRLLYGASQFFSTNAPNAIKMTLHGNLVIPAGTALPYNFGPPNDIGQPVYRPTTVVGPFFATSNWWTGSGGYVIGSRVPVPSKAFCWATGTNSEIRSDGYYAGTYHIINLPGDGSPIQLPILGGARRHFNPSGGTFTLRYVNGAKHPPPYTYSSTTVSYTGTGRFSGEEDIYVKNVTGYPVGKYVPQWAEFDTDYYDPAFPEATFAYSPYGARPVPFVVREDGSFEIPPQWDYDDLARAIQTASVLAPDIAHPSGLTFSEAQDIAQYRDIQNAPDPVTGKPSAFQGMATLPWDLFLTFYGPGFDGIHMIPQ